MIQYKQNGQFEQYRFRNDFILLRNESQTAKTTLRL